MLIISTPIITKADLIEGSIINCVQCDIQIYMHMNEIKVRVTRSKVESLRLDLSFHGTNYHRLHLFARPCYTLHAFIEMRPFYSTFAFRRNWNESTKMLPKTATIGFKFEKEAWSVTQNQARIMCLMYAEQKFIYYEKLPKNDENDTYCCTSLPKKIHTATLII